MGQLATPGNARYINAEPAFTSPETATNTTNGIRKQVAAYTHKNLLAPGSPTNAYSSVDAIPQPKLYVKVAVDFKLLKVAKAPTVPEDSIIEAELIIL